MQHNPMGIRGMPLYDAHCPGVRPGHRDRLARRTPAYRQRPAYPLDGDYILTQDIEASATASWNDGAGFDPIGTHDLIVPERAFTGTFDGQGYVISNLYINRPERNWTGLFGAVGDRGIIQNLGLESGAVTGNSFVAGLAVHLGRGSMSNCYATCAVTGKLVCRRSGWKL